MKTRLEKIRQKITGAPRYPVPPELDRKVQAALGLPARSPMAELESEETLLSFNWITPWLMKSFKQFAVVVAVLTVMLGGSWFYAQNSYAYHLEKAKAALADLQSVLNGKPIAQNPWIGQAFAEDTVPAVDSAVSAPAVNEAQVVNLTQVVVQETEKAINIVENKTDPVVVGQALAEVVTVQDQTVPLLAAAVEAVTTAEATQAVAAAIETTATDQVVVVQAQEFVALAASNGETQVAIDIQTASDAKPAVAAASDDEEKKDDGKRLEEAKAAYEEAKAQIGKLKASGADAEVLAKLQSKLDKVVAAFEDGKIGRAHGLTTALMAQGRHLAKKEVREEKRRKEESKKEVDEGEDVLKSDTDELEKDDEKKEDSKVEDSDREGRKEKIKIEDARKPELKKVEPTLKLKVSDELRKGVDDEDDEDDEGDDDREESEKESHPRIPKVERSGEGGRGKND